MKMTHEDSNSFIYVWYLSTQKYRFAIFNPRVHYYYYENFKTCLEVLSENQKSMAGFVIQATRTVEFEDGLWTGVLPEGYLGP